MPWFNRNNDRRAAKRLPFELKARFRVMRIGRGSPLSDWEPARAMNLSPEGLCLACESMSAGGFSLVRCLEEAGGNFIRVEITSPELSWELDCRLVWVNREDEEAEQPCRLGLMLMGGAHPPGWKKLAP